MSEATAPTPLMSTGQAGPRDVQSAGPQDSIESSMPAARTEAYIPAPKYEIVKTAADELSEGDRLEFLNVCRLLAATLHYDYYDTQEAMRRAYSPFDPDTEKPQTLNNAELDAAWTRFNDALTIALTAANFEEIDADSESHAALRESESGVRVKTTRAGLRLVRHFVRNRRRAHIQRRRFWGLQTQMIEADVFGDVVMVVGYKAEHEITPKERAAMPRAAKKNLRPSSAFVKQFKNIARGDLESLHPGAKITMKRSDQVLLAAPALFGGVPLIVNLLPALSVLFIVIGAYLGFQSGSVTHDSTRKALAALSGLVALGAFMMRQRLKYEAQSLRYQKRLSDNIYYRNVANNAGVFDILISAAEEQELKEAVTAYQRLIVQGPMTQSALDKECEAWIARNFCARVNFEVEDAAQKLIRMGLIAKNGDQLIATPPSSALEKLDAAWDAIFDYKLKMPASGPAL